VTDRCNLRCRYCMPREVFGAGFRFLPREQLLSYEEIARVVAALATLGVRKVRLTGGEPLLRRDLERLIEMLARTEGIEDIALTTNGLLLADRAAGLRAAGLGRVTVSLDALDDHTLHAVADAPISPGRVLAGIDAAADAGLDPVKVNMVVRRGLNDHAILGMAERFRGTGAVLRFIEYMDVGSTNGWTSADVVPAVEILERIGERWPLEPLAPNHTGEVASRYRYADGAGEVGVVHSISEPFCGSCTRARLSADGKLYTCLFASGGHDVRALLRSEAGEEELVGALREIWRGRRDRYSAERAERARSPLGDRATQRVEMSYIGG
jgi:cyclic pyranopterin phosphate synthase